MMQETASLFDRISRRYDLMNRIISFGRDMHWRRELTDRLDDKGSRLLLVLDIAAGTGDQMMLLSCRTGVRRIIGIDTSTPMLAIARRKLKDTGCMAATSLIGGDSHRLPFTDGLFDAVTVSFGIRNFHDRPQALREIHRVLTPGGRLLILELTIPENRFILPLYLLYTRMVVPLLGSLIAGDFSAYRYLNHSVEAFPPTGMFVGMMAEAGFREIEAIPITFGTATIFTGIS